MSVISILAVVGIIVYVVIRQTQGEMLRARRAILLPVVLTVVGFTDLRSAQEHHFQSVDILWLTIGCVGSALIGFAFGAITRLESRDGYLWARLPLTGLWLWGALLVWRGLVMVLAGSMHAHVAASASTLLFSLGVNRLAQAAVIVPRALATGVPFAPEEGGAGLLGGLLDGGPARDRRR
ncbi:DUF1453 family protein [Actinospica robiniae]|uniref:DUF1453 family protein n=1 Tax=Actinospica robiniae TaxID=304901 RepID=UPI0003F6F4FD|nr:DUF1453 family protein [Actinospica robiniae]